VISAARLAEEVSALPVGGGGGRLGGGGGAGRCHLHRILESTTQHHNPATKIHCENYVKKLKTTTNTF
jgi:hypothetical protein